MATKNQKTEAFKYAKDVIRNAATGGCEVVRLSNALELVYEATLKIQEDIDKTPS